MSRHNFALFSTFQFSVFFFSPQLRSLASECVCLVDVFKLHGNAAMKFNAKSISLPHRTTAINNRRDLNALSRRVRSKINNNCRGERISMMEERTITIYFLGANIKIVHDSIDSIETGKWRKRWNWCKADQSRVSWARKEEKKKRKKWNTSQNHVCSWRQQHSIRDATNYIWTIWLYVCLCSCVYLSVCVCAVRVLRYYARSEKIGTKQKTAHQYYLYASVYEYQWQRNAREICSSSPFLHRKAVTRIFSRLFLPCIHSFVRLLSWCLCHVFHANVDLSMRINRKRANSRSREKNIYLYKHLSLCPCQVC